MPIVVTDYNARWADTFQQLRACIWPSIADFASSLEHVGSTSVPGLAAKPIIDMTIVTRDEKCLAQVIQRLDSIGYLHRGDLGVKGREAFTTPRGTPDHHLYACVQGCLALRNHLALRDRLRRDPAAVKAYGELKQQLASRHTDDIDAYIDGKTAFIVSLLREEGIMQDEVDRISAINSLPKEGDLTAGCS